MSTIVYEAGRASLKTLESAVAGSARVADGLFTRLMTRLIEYRTRQALMEIRRHRPFLPRELEGGVGAFSENSLPFIRR